MILRNIAVRHGRNVLTAPLRRACIRFLTTESSNPQPSIDPFSRATSALEADLNRPQPSKPFISSTDSLEGESLSSRTVDNVIAANHSSFKHVTSTTGTLGSTLGPYYRSSKQVNQPLGPEDITLEVLMASQAHMGHATRLWNPANQRYITGIREGVHIISLEVTAAYLRRACRVTEGVAYHGGLILFVGTREGQYRCVVKAAELAQGCHIFERWVPGSITNGNQIIGLGGMRAIDENDEEIKSPVFEEKLSDYRALKPDLVVVLNPLENYVCLHECALSNIPTIGIIDTDADPTWVTYPIPANDDSLRCVQLITGVLGRAAEAGQKKRLAAAKKGKVTWRTPKEYKQWVDKDPELIKKLLGNSDEKFLSQLDAKEAAMREEAERREAWEG